MQTHTQRLSPAAITGPLTLTHTHRTRRRDTRVELLLPVYIRRPENSAGFRKEAETLNVSRSGAGISLDVPLEEGALLVVYAFGDQFVGKAIVKHVERQGESWALGLEFIEKHGKWIIV